jgi:hypothetical protein
VELYRKLGKPDEAARWREKLSAPAKSPANIQR